MWAEPPYFDCRNGRAEKFPKGETAPPSVGCSAAPRECYFFGSDTMAAPRR